MSAPAVPVLRSATAADADAVTAVHLASRAAAMPWLPVVHTPAETRWWVEHVLLSRYRTFAFAVFTCNAPARASYERQGCRVVAESDGRDNEEREPDVTYAWRP